MFRLSRRACLSSSYRGLLRLPLTRAQPLSSDSKDEIKVPEHVERHGEPVEVLRARLQYQSRKRGTLENGLLLSTFCSHHLKRFTEPQLAMYDDLINKPSDEWDIFYWATGKKPVPVEFDNEIMSLLKEFTKNTNKESRISQPPLEDTWK